MKNLIEELHKLDDYEYKVSADFSKNVIKSIKKAKKSSKITYVISWASIGVVACLAVFAFNNTGIKTNLFYKESSEVVEDNTNNLDLASTDTAKSNDALTTSSASGSNNVENFSVKEEKIESDTVEVISTEEVGNEIQKNTMVEDKYSKQHHEIEDALKKAKLKYEKIDNEFKVNASIEEVTKILKDFKDITIEIKEDYIIIGIKE